MGSNPGLHNPARSVSFCAEGGWESLKGEPCRKYPTKNAVFRPPEICCCCVSERTERASLFGAQTLRVFSVSTFGMNEPVYTNLPHFSCFYSHICPFFGMADSHSTQTCCLSGNQQNAVTSTSKWLYPPPPFFFSTLVSLQFISLFWAQANTTVVGLLPNGPACLDVSGWWLLRNYSLCDSQVPSESEINGVRYPLTSREFLNAPQSLPVIMRYQMHHCSGGDIVDLLSAQLCSVFSKSQSKVKISTDLKIRTLTCTVKDSNLLPFILVGINPLKFELTGISLPPYMNVKSTHGPAGFESILHKLVFIKRESWGCMTLQAPPSSSSSSISM